MRDPDVPARRTRARRAMGALSLVAVAALVAVACQPVTLGGPGSVFGNDLDPANCPQSQPASTAPCGPQPLLWASINGPGEVCANGDPFAAKACATYRTTGYAFAVDVAAADVGAPLTVQVYDLGTYQRTVGYGTSYDCNKSLAPFNAAPYTSSSFTSQHCQTGENGTGMDMDLQLYAGDGSEAANYTTPIDSCHLAHTGAELTAAKATYMNKWVPICTFTPTTKGVHALRVRSSGLPGMSDTPSGLNQYALKVTGGAATALRPIDDASIWLNTPMGDQTIYLGDVPGSFAGKRLMIDLFDPGDGNNTGTTAWTVQVKAPPGGTSVAPAGTGTVVPAPGVASSCRYNATPSVTPSPDTPDVADACTVATQNAGMNGGGIYNGRWLRIEVTLDPAYSCTTDCRWTLQYHRETVTFPTDRLTYALSVV